MTDTNQSNNQKESPSEDRTRILDAVDFEIQRIDTEQSRKGWTFWAVLGAAGSGVWLILDQFGSVLHVITVLQLTLCFTSVVISFILISNSLLPQSLNKNFSLRFRSAKEMNRLQILFELIRSVGILLISLLITDGVSLSSRILTGVIFGFLALLCLGALIFSLFGLAMQVPSKPDSRTNLGFGIALVLLSWIVYSYTAAAMSSPDGISSADFRMAGLIVAVSYLIPVMASQLTASPLLSSLIEIRRDLAMGRIDCENAAQQLDIAVLGMKTEDLLQEDVRKILQNLENVNRQLALQSTSFENFNYSEMENVPEQEFKAWLSSFIDLNTNLSDNNAKLIDATNKQLNILGRRIMFLPKNSETSRAVAAVRSKMMNVVEETQGLLQSNKERIRQIKEDVVSESVTFPLSDETAVRDATAAPKNDHDLPSRY